MILLKSLEILFFPESCLHCGASYGEEGERGLCCSCERDLELFDGPHCERCSYPTESRLCRRCKFLENSYSRCFVLGWYENVLASIIKSAKFTDDFSGLDRLVTKLKSRLDARTYDAIVCVPSDHLLNRKCAEKLSDELKISIIHALTRDRKARRQVGLSRKERRKAASKSLEIVSNNLPQTILLIDDITTTGATLEAASNVLLENGAIQVDAAVLARTRAPGRK